jgi:hypothetical protein
LTDKSEIADTGATINVQNLPHGETVVSVIYPENRRRGDRRVFKIICVILAVAPLIVWLIFRKSDWAMYYTIGAAVAACALLAKATAQYRVATRSYVFRVDHASITVETSNDRRTNSVRYRRDQIQDIKLGFSRTRSATAVQCWMVIDTCDGRIKCLQEVGGDHLAHIANVLRAGLGMPARSWP